MKSHPNSTFYFPSECKEFNLVSTKTGLWKEKEKTTLSQMFLPKFYKIRLNLKSPLNLSYLKCTKSSLHGFEKELEILQTNILLGKGCDFSKSLEPNTVLSYKTFTEIVRYLQSHLN